MADDNAYEVRIHFKQGGFLNYGFEDVGRAHAFAEMAAEAKMQAASAKPANQTQGHGFDDSGREVYLDGRDISVVQFIDIKAEVRGNLRRAAVDRHWTSVFAPMYGLGPNKPETANGPVRVVQPDYEGLPPVTPAIGRFAT
jgi:hypothetical protein